MRDLGRQITTLQSQMTAAVQSGETENSPHLRQMDARLLDARKGCACL